MPYFAPVYAAQAPAIQGAAGIYGATALGAVGFGLGAFQAVSNKRAIKRNMNALAGATSTNLGQVNQQSELEQFNNRRAIREAMGRVATAIAASGGSGGVTGSDLVGQVAGDGGINASVIETNRANSNRSIRSQYRAQAEQIRSQYQNPLLAGVGAAVNTFSLGLNLFQGINALQGMQSSQISASSPLG